MRDLTKEQRSLLRKWYNSAEPSKEAKMLFGKINPLFRFEDLSTEQIEELEQINDSEVLYQYINSYLNDLRNEVKQ